MKVPYTIPKTVLRAYTRNLNEEALKKSYEGRLLVSEDPTWDKDLAPTLAEQCRNLVLDEFIFFHKLVEYFNDQKLGSYDQQKGTWEKNLSEYLERRALYEQKLADYETRLAQYGDGNDYDDYDDEDPSGIKVDAKGRPIEPDKIEDEFQEYEPVPSVLDQLKDDDRIHIVEEIELDLVPLPLAIKIIPDEYYWERKVRDRWQVFDLNDHDKSWRRLYMEKHAWEAIEKFHPADDDFDKLKEELEMVAPEVIRLFIQNLIPVCFGTPAKEVVAQTFEGDNGWGPDDEFDVGFGDDDMFQDPDDEGVSVSEETVKSLTSKKKNKKKANKDDPPKSTDEKDYIIPPEKRNPEMDRQDSSHLDFSLILPMFTNLKEMTVIYQMVETGLDWEDRYFKFSDTDCLNLAKALSECQTLEKFELLRSHVEGEQCKTLVREGLIKMPHLKYLNLNYNRIGDVGARAVARLLIDESSQAMHTIHTVRVARNRIHNAGGKALAYALTKNNHLTTLDARLNSLGDSAGCDFGHSLVKNSSLLAIFLSANKLTEETAYVLGKMLFHNKSIKELDVSSNDLGKKGGEYLALGMRNNRTILRLDVRLTNIGLDFEYDVGTHLKKNRNRIAAFHSIVDGDDYGPPEIESGLLDLEDVPSDESDDEGEEDDDEEECDDEEEMEEGANENEEEEETEEPGLGNAVSGTGTATAGSPSEKEMEKSVNGVTAAMLAQAGLMDYAAAQQALNDPRVAAALNRAMQGTGDGKKVEVDNNRTNAKGGKCKKCGTNNNKELKVVKGPQEMKSSKHAFF